MFVLLRVQYPANRTSDAAFTWHLHLLLLHYRKATIAVLLKPVGLNAWSEHFVLPAALAGAPQGVLQVDYEVTRYDDVRNLTSSRSYLVKCKQRVIVPNTVASTFGPVNTTSYTYPVMLINKMSIAEVDGNQATWTLMEYSPKTLNSAIQSSINSSLGTSTQATSQYTSGSSTSDTNSYEVGISAAGLSAGASHSSTNTTDQSTSSGSSKGVDLQSSTSDSMSIKDWAGFAALNPASASPDVTWVWGQEYPWDVFQYHNVYIPNPGDQPYIQVPAAIMNQMYHLADPDASGGDTTVVYPPSKLSLFGPNFVSKATWLYTVNGPQTNPYDQIQFTHAVTCYTGMHCLPDLSSFLQITLDKSWDFEVNNTSTPPTALLDLGKLALDPIPASQSDEGAIVGFARSQFLAPPDNAEGFSIKSTANTLYVTGNGFTAPLTNDAPMTADLTKGAATFTAFLKVDDADRDLSLFIKHWKMSQTGCLMTIQVNPPVSGGTSPGPGSDPITRYVDAFEAGSGTDNITEIILRKKDYASADFYDYLALGMNAVTVKVESLDSTSSSCTYAIRAVVVA